MMNITSVCVDGVVENRFIVDVERRYADVYVREIETDSGWQYDMGGIYFYHCTQLAILEGSRTVLQFRDKVVPFFNANHHNRFSTVQLTYHTQQNILGFECPSVSTHLSPISRYVRQRQPQMKQLRDLLLQEQTTGGDPGTIRQRCATM